MKKVIFWDRDGTLSHHCSTSKYTVHPEQITLKPGINHLQDLQDAFEFIIITNAGGVGRGLFSPQAFWTGQNYFEELAQKSAGISFEKCYPAFWHPQSPQNFPELESCRKPNTGLIEQAIHDSTEAIDLDNSWVVGDSNVDIEVAHRMGLKSFFIADDHNDEKYKKLTNFIPTGAGKNLQDAVEFIKNYPQS